jgi:phosphopantetheine--protein transferase-like protein
MEFSHPAQFFSFVMFVMGSISLSRGFQQLNFVRKAFSQIKDRVVEPNFPLRKVLSRKSNRWMSHSIHEDHKISSATPIIQTANGHKFFTRDHYPTVGNLTMCGANIQIVQSPHNIESLLPQYQPDNLGEILVDELQSIDLPLNGSMNRLNEFIAGRVALRRCFGSYCDDISWEEVMKPLIKAPGPVQLPQGWIGSISHKTHIAIAGLRRAAGLNDQLGVDVENIVYAGKWEQRFIEKTSTLFELEKQPTLSGLSETEMALLRFSMKESVFKAIYHSLRRHVGYHEVEIFPSLDGTAEVKFKLNKDALSYGAYKAEWLKYNDKYFITTFYLCKDM